MHLELNDTKYKYNKSFMIHCHMGHSPYQLKINNRNSQLHITRAEITYPTYPPKVAQSSFCFQENHTRRKVLHCLQSKFNWWFLV